MNSWAAVGGAVSGDCGTFSNDSRIRDEIFNMILCVQSPVYNNQQNLILAFLVNLEWDFRSIYFVSVALFFSENTVFK